MLTEYGNSIKKEVKITRSEIKIYRKPAVKGRKLGFNTRAIAGKVPVAYGEWVK